MRCFLPIFAFVLAVGSGGASAVDLVSYRFERGVATTGDSAGALVGRAARRIARHNWRAATAPALASVGNTSAARAV
jgi:hypothetical protein